MQVRVWGLMVHIRRGGNKVEGGMKGGIREEQDDCGGEVESQCLAKAPGKMPGIPKRERERVKHPPPFLVLSHILLLLTAAIYLCTFNPGGLVSLAITLSLSLSLFHFLFLSFVCAFTKPATLCIIIPWSEEQRPNQGMMRNQERGESKEGGKERRGQEKVFRGWIQSCWVRMAHAHLGILRFHEKNKRHRRTNPHTVILQCVWRTVRVRTCSGSELRLYYINFFLQNISEKKKFILRTEVYY